MRCSADFVLGIIVNLLYSGGRHGSESAAVVNGLLAGLGLLQQRLHASPDRRCYHLHRLSRVNRQYASGFSGGDGLVTILHPLEEIVAGCFDPVAPGFADYRWRVTLRPCP